MSFSIRSFCWSVRFLQSSRNSKLQENSNLWILMWTKLNIAWKCICLTFLKYFRGNYSADRLLSIFYSFLNKILILNSFNFFWLFGRHNVKVVPILVGAVNSQNEAMYGQLLSKYVDDPKNFFSVSSDFCHWGSR